MEKKRKKSKNQKLHGNLKKLLTDFFAGKRKTPLDIEAVRKKLSLPEEHIPILAKILDELSQDGYLSNQNGAYSLAAMQKELSKA